jgi:glyoxylase-like metal-dependent hydrolase (beta-lactamase superfamily II)
MRLFGKTERGPLRAEHVRPEMTRRGLLAAGCACCAAQTLAFAAAPAMAQQPAAPAAPAAAPPAFATRKITDTTYIFRYQGHQSMFVVTPAGVIATDPIGLRRPQAVTAYIEEIRKITPAPVKYVIYSHHHYDHIAGGKPFKDLGATFVAHRNATARLRVLKDPDVVLPDVSTGERHQITLGGVRVELTHVGKNHSDNSLVIGVPKDKLIFAVDFIPIETLPFRDMPDAYLPEWLASLDRVLGMNWEQLIPGHPNAGGRLGTKADVQNLRTYFIDLMQAVRAAAGEGKCYDRAMAEVKLPKYESWGSYQQFLAGNVSRMCAFMNGV